VLSRRRCGAPAQEAWFLEPPPAADQLVVGGAPDRMASRAADVRAVPHDDRLFSAPAEGFPSGLMLRPCCHRQQRGESAPHGIIGNFGKVDAAFLPNSR
jgi:hypothetical protein